MRETGSNGYKRQFMDTLEELYPGCLLLLLDPGHIQGIPDLLMLYGDFWAAFEVKASKNARRQPNQPYYVGYMAEMSFAAFVYPENEEAVLHELQQEYESRRSTRAVEPEQLRLAGLRSRQAYSGVSLDAAETTRRRPTQAGTRSDQPRYKASR